MVSSVSYLSTTQFAALSTTRRDTLGTDAIRAIGTTELSRLPGSAILSPSAARADVLTGSQAAAMPNASA